MVCKHLVKFGDHRHCGSGNIMVLVCYMILHNHMNKALSNFTDGSRLR